MPFTKVCSTSDVSAGAIRQFEVSHKTVAIANVGGNFYAINGHCPHAGGPLGEGMMNGKNVTCPWHESEFDVTTGKVLSPPAQQNVACFRVKVEGNDVLVDL